MPLASSTGPLTITKPEAGDNVKTHETGTGATGYNHANLDNINAALNATTGHDHDGTDSKKVLATNLDRTGGTARQQLVVNSGATALEYAASMQSLLTAQGDLPYASAANTPARLAKGTAGQLLAMNSGATAPEWVGAGWTAFTPTLDQGGTVAATVNLARYSLVGKTAVVQIKLTATAVGSASNLIKITSIPAAIAPANPGAYILGGSFVYYDADVGLKAGVAQLDSATVLVFWRDGQANGLGLEGTPTTIAVGDVIGCYLCYEVA